MPAGIYFLNAGQSAAQKLVSKSRRFTFLRDIALKTSKSPESMMP
jgi:hypothetical protein